MINEIYNPFWLDGKRNFLTAEKGFSFNNKIMKELLIPHECHSCGVIDEAKFVYAGPHIKQVCNGCGKYVKFFSKYAIPDVKEIKLKIWGITRDISKIDEIKSNLGFPNDTEYVSNIDSKMMYWRLYLTLRQEDNLCK